MKMTLEKDAAPSTTDTSTPNPAKPIVKVPNSRLRRWLTILAVKTGQRVCRKRGCVILFPFRICIKRSSITHSLAEAKSLLFVADNTDVPVPRVYCAFMRKDVAYTVMSRIKGETLRLQWSKMSETARASILQQLVTMMSKLRSIEPSKGAGVGNLGGGPLFDQRVPGPSNIFGPFARVADFHRFLRRGYEEADANEEVMELIRMQKEVEDEPIVFTHGDLSSFNIMVKGDKVTGIIDWETAGWFPAYWESAVAKGAAELHSFWGDEVPRLLEPSKRTWEMEALRRRLFA